MYVVSGANLHGQWFDANQVIEKFQPASIRQSEDYTETKLIHISWSYNLFQDKNKFYLAGSLNGKNNTFIELDLPTNIIYSLGGKPNRFMLSGNDYSLFLFEVELHIMWVISLEDPQNVKQINLKMEIPATKRMKVYDPILKVYTSNFNCICLTAEGNVYSGLLPGPVGVSDCLGKVCDVQCGYEHHLLLTDEGRVYSWGNGRRLQLGHGDLSNIEAPKEIEALSGIKIIKISAGGWHSLALSESGDLYAWGWNDNGQLGIKEIEKESGPNSYNLPTLVDVFDENGDIYNINVKDISCGNLHSAIIFEDDSVWTAGSNKYGQLGLAIENTNKVYYFQKTYQSSENLSIKCGPWVTVIY